MTETTHHAPERPEVTEVREAGRTTVLVIGGGINGISTFRDLALQGVDVVLIERGDFASGASSASSHMIHGGIRYLENGEFRLVRESVTERNGLIRIAPHYVKPLETTIPIYSTFSGILSAPLRFLTHRSGKPQERGAFLIKVGLTIYDTFSRDGGSVPRHRFLGRKKSLAELPAMDPKIKYTATYYDASMHDPERLALDVLQDGRAAHPGARALNYVEAIGHDGEAVRVRDRESGTEFSIAADVVVNTSGPWTDLTNEAMGELTRFMGGTKGSHIVLDNPELLSATKGREIFFEHSDGRIVLIYPLKGKVMVGTTDIDADPREVPLCTEEEIDYFFALVHHVFPTIDVNRDQIVYRFSGIRPLPRHEDTAPGFVSRDYRVEVDTSRAVPHLSLVGGKWTTFRALGETLSDKILEILGRTRVVSTAGRAIGGGKGYPQGDAARAAWISQNLAGAGDRAEALLVRYGTRATEVWQYVEQGEDAPLAGGALSTRELAWMVEHEMIVRLEDVVLRRTSLAFTGSVTEEILEELANALAPLLGWDRARAATEIELTRGLLNTRHGLSLVARTHG
ncbi:glycerol-3-phosphate dehydrogenase/oxidase [Microbacterium panaciterrae]|uniref:Glycerol-3-phosphate dehydrogenase/oxidase n=1 Tax=Microbacterium panaciterrae TaxID=985759 RepID=A0ABP8P776_9MICO